MPTSLDATANIVAIAGAGVAATATVWTLVVKLIERHESKAARRKAEAANRLAEFEQREHRVKEHQQTTKNRLRTLTVSEMREAIRDHDRRAQGQPVALDHLDDGKDGHPSSQTLDREIHRRLRRRSQVTLWVTFTVVWIAAVVLAVQ